MLAVELVYAPQDAPAIHLRLRVADGCTVNDVLTQSGLLDSHPELKDLPVGIFSKRVDRLTRVTSGDRIEIYRPLLIDPMEKRRQRAKRD
jgi:putative ubiquitin-RnfH superfamily antitoxin RatB of RatAB toxin-antitoxin module